MFKKILLVSGLFLLIGVLVFGALNRTLAKTTSGDVSPGSGSGYGRNGNVDEVDSAQNQLNDEYDVEHGDGLGRGSGNRQGSAGEHSESDVLPSKNTKDLSSAEADALTYMREEEKLAHDVYVTFYELWGGESFQNIAASEQTHTESVLALLERYNLPDPSSGEVGVFTNSDLQALYNQLIAKGSLSQVDALEVGAAIEELDILDLQNHLTQVDNADIQHVFENLQHASGHHLSAFVSEWEAQTGSTYQPQYMSMEDYQALAIDSNGKGNGRQGNGNSENENVGNGDQQQGSRGYRGGRQ